MRSIGSSHFGACVLCGVDEGRRTCINGLPVIPASVRMLGRFQKLKQLSHPAICQYMELIRCSTAINAVILVSEHYKLTLADLIGDVRLTDDVVRDVLCQIVEAVHYLHENGITSGMISLEHISIIDPNSTKMNVRLTQYGLSYVSMNGRDIEDGLFGGFSMSLERLIKGSIDSTTMKDDIWAIGILVIQLCSGVRLDKIWSFRQFLSILQSSVARVESNSLLNPILSALSTSIPYLSSMPQWAIDVAERCLMLLPSQRISIVDLRLLLESHKTFPVMKQTIDSVNAIQESIDNVDRNWKLHEMPLDEAFFLWRLSGSSAESILIKNDVIRLQAPVNTVPSLVVEDLLLLGNEEGRKFHVNCQIFSLPDENLRKKVEDISDECFLTSLMLDSKISLIPSSSDSLSIIVKEKDVAYQAVRMAETRYILESWAFRPDELRRTVLADIPPVLRARVWSCLLGIRASDCDKFSSLDTLAPSVSDRQLDVDIPRCHQYEELMTSPSAHTRLRRLLKAWLLHHPQYVYWQGCDSLAAPFLLLHFNNLPMAFASLSAFIDRYLYNFFLKDNSAVIQEYLAVFNQLVAFLDSSLYAHLANLDFFPELFAIPWFLTCFAHVLPLHKLVHVWDQLLLRDASFPLFVGVAVLRQLRPRLITSSFNDAILLFSDLPDLIMEKVITDSIEMSDIVPISCSYTKENRRLDGASTLTPFDHRELKTWCCPRLSAQDLLTRVQSQCILVIDIRTQQEYARGCVVRSINYPDPEDPALLNIKEVLKGAQRNKHPVCILTGKDNQAAKKFSSLLVLSGIDGVCVLEGGFETIRQETSIITVS